MINDIIIDKIGSIEQHIPLGRLCTPADVVSSVIWMSSEETSFITGTSLILDGGIMAY